MIQGVGQFHSVTIDSTLHYHWGGGIAVDLVRFGDLNTVVAVPEPETYAMLLAGLGLLGLRKRIA